MHYHDDVGQDPEDHGASGREGTPPHARPGRPTDGASRPQGVRPVGCAGPPLVRWAAALVALGYGWWAVGLEPFSGAATAAVVAAGVAAMAWGRWRPARPRRCSHPAGGLGDRCRTRLPPPDGDRAVERPPVGPPSRSAAPAAGPFRTGLLGPAAWWGVLAAATAAWQLAAFVQQPRGDHPTISSLANALLGSQPARAAAFVAWLAGAAGLARR